MLGGGGGGGGAVITWRQVSMLGCGAVRTERGRGRGGRGGEWNERRVGGGGMQYRS